MQYQNFLSAKFWQENFDDSTCTCQIRQTFPPSKFYAIRYQGKIFMGASTNTKSMKYQLASFQKLQAIQQNICVHNQLLHICSYVAANYKLSCQLHHGRVVRLQVKMNFIISKIQFDGVQVTTGLDWDVLLHSSYL